MTDDMIAPRGLMERGADADLLREMIGYGAQRLLELEVGGSSGVRCLSDRTAVRPVAQSERKGRHPPRPLGRLGAAPTASGHRIYGGLRSVPDQTPSVSRNAAGAHPPFLR